VVSSDRIDEVAFREYKVRIGFQRETRCKDQLARRSAVVGESRGRVARRSGVVGKLADQEQVWGKW